MAVMVEEAALGGFDALPTGPALAAALESVDPASLIGQEVAAWMRAGFRVRNHADWLLLRAIREACRSRADTTMRVEDEFAAKIAAANLGWSTAMACTRLDLAVGVLERMPALGERMRTGELELIKAASFVTGLEGLTPSQCDAVLATLLDEARDLPLGQLRDRILSAGYEVDHVWGANRLAAATARARVSTETAPSGAVNVCGRDLDPDLAQDATQRLRALALAVRARLRAAGHKLALGFIEARVFVRLMDGTLAGAADSGVIDAVTAELAKAGGPDDGPGDDAGPDDGPGDDGPGDDGPGDDAGPDDGPGDDDAGPDEGPGGDAGPGDDTGPDDGPSDDGPHDRDTGRAHTGLEGRGVDPDDGDGGLTDGPAGGPEHGSGDPERGADEPEPAGAVRGEPRSVVFAPGTAVCLGLSTLLGLDDAPGILPGTGPVPGGTARTAAYARGAAAWQVLVHDDHGHLTHLLALRAPPGAARDPRHRRRTVRLTASAALLRALGSEVTGEVGPPGLARARTAVLDEATTMWLRRAHGALIASENADPEDHPATTTRDRDRRFPGARLAAWVVARDQNCVAPGCTRPAETCDLDHTIGWAREGPTEAGDLGALCRRDHRAKHEGGWTYEQPEPGRFVITDPTGTRHHVESRVVHPRPAPVAPGHAITPEPGPPIPPRPEWHPRRTRDGRITTKARATADRLARRDRERQQQPPSRYDRDPDF